MYADVELLLTAFIKLKRPAVHVCTELPANLADVLPVAQVHRIAGGDSDIVLDGAIVDVDAFAVDRAAARLLGEQIRSDFRLALSGYMSGGAVVSNVETINGPYWVPYDNTNLRRYTSSYRVTVHSTP